MKHVYSPGEVITCAAEGNPEPELRWVDEESGDEVADSGVLVIDNSMEGTGTYSCLATNVVRGVTYSLTTTITFTVISKNRLNEFFPIILLLLLYYYFYSSKIPKIM